MNRRTFFPALAALAASWRLWSRRTPSSATVPDVDAYIGSRAGVVQTHEARHPPRETLNVTVRVRKGGKRWLMSDNAAFVNARNYLEPFWPMQGYLRGGNHYIRIVESKSAGLLPGMIFPVTSIRRLRLIVLDDAGMPAPILPGDVVELHSGEYV